MNQVHEKKLDSTTLQGIVMMILSFLLSMATANGWIPPFLVALIEPMLESTSEQVVSLLDGSTQALLVAVFGFAARRGWTGRLNAVKGFK